MIDPNVSNAESIALLASSDYEVLYAQSQEANAKLKADLEAVRQSAERAGHPDARPGQTAEAGKAQLIRERGAAGFLNASRADKLRAIGIHDPASVDDTLLARAWGLGNDGTVLKDLHLTNKGRTRQLREAALILDIFGKRPKQ